MFEKIDLGITTTLCYNLMTYAQEMWKYVILCCFYSVYYVLSINAINRCRIIKSKITSFYVWKFIRGYRLDNHLSPHIYYSLKIPYFDKIKNSDLAVAKNISWKTKPCIPKCWVIYFEMSWILLPQTSNVNKKVFKLFLYCYFYNQQNRKINILYAFCWSWFLLTKVGGYYHLYCHILHMLMFSL